MAQPRARSWRSSSLTTRVVSASRPGEGLVEDQDLRLREERAGEDELLAHALGETEHRVVQAGGQAEVAEQVLGAGGDRGLVQAVEPAVQLQRLARRQQLVEAAVLGDVGGQALGLLGRFLDVVGSQEERAGARLLEAQQAAHCRGLAGAIGSEEGEHLTGLDREGEPRDRPLLAITDLEILDADERMRGWRVCRHLRAL
jgi:hypothetical protein